MKNDNRGPAGDVLFLDRPSLNDSFALTVAATATTALEQANRLIGLMMDGMNRYDKELYRTKNLLEEKKLQLIDALDRVKVLELEIREMREEATRTEGEKA